MTETELLALTAESIRAWRRRAGLTISELAELAGIDGGFLAYIETRKKLPSLLTAVRLAQALDITLAQLFEGAPRRGPDRHYQLTQQLRCLFNRATPRHRDDATIVIRLLTNPRKARALREILGPAASSRRERVAS